MSTFFERAVDLRIGMAINPQVTIMGPCRAWRDLRVEFEVSKSTSRKANVATIKLYNPDAASVALIQQANMVQLFAGYAVAGPILPVLFTGSIANRGVRVKKKAKRSVSVERQETDLVITIEAGDAHSAFKTVRLDLSFAAGTDNNTMLFKLMALLGLGMGSGMTALPPVIYPKPTGFHGSATRALEQLCRDAGCTWSVQNGNLQLLLAGQASVARAVVLSPDTGLIGVPEVTDNGINARSLLNADISPGSMLSLVSMSATGFYKSKVVKHRGDTHGTEWTTEVEAVPIG